MLKTAVMKFVGRTAGYSLLNHRRSEDISELRVDPVEKKIAHYKQKWINHVCKVEDTRLDFHGDEYSCGRIPHHYTVS